MNPYRSRLQEKQISIDVLELLSAKAYNLLMLNEQTYIHQLAFRTKEDLQTISRMDSGCAAEIARWTEAYIGEHAQEVFAEYCRSKEPVLTLDKMRFMAEYQQKILEFVLKNDISVESMPISARPKNQLQRNGYHKLSDIVFLTEEQLKRLPSMGSTLEEIGQEYGVTRERIRQIIKKKTGEIRNFYAMATGDRWFDEDYYWYFYETYAFDRREASAWMGIPETVWKYLDMMDVKQGKRDPESALDDSENLEIGLRLKVKNYLNRNKIFLDGVWVENKRGELEPIIAKKFCRNEISFDAFAKVFNDFLAEEEIPYDEELYYTEAVARTRKNRLADSRFILWKQNEMLRYYDIDSRDYTELLETLKLDTYENVEYSTMKFVKEYPQLMEKYDIRDHYELHNLLRKIVPEGSFHAFRCGRTPVIEFGVFDRDSAILDLKSLRQRLTYVVLFSNKLMELKRSLDIIEFEPGQILNFRKLSRAGITKEDIRQFCDAVYNFIPENSYFTAQSLKADGFESDLYDLGFSDRLYANVDLYYRDLEEGGF